MTLLEWLGLHKVDTEVGRPRFLPFDVEAFCPACHQRQRVCRGEMWPAYCWCDAGRELIGVRNLEAALEEEDRG